MCTIGKENRGKIIGIPNSEYDYEFMMIEKLSDGNFRWLGNYENYPYKEVEKYRGNKDIVIVHNVRIAHKQKKEGI